MQGPSRHLAVGSTLVSFHVQGDTLANVLGRTHRINVAPGLAETAIATFDGIARSRQQSIVQEDQGLLQVRSKQFAQGAAHAFEPPDTPAELGQFGQGRFRPALPIESAAGGVDLIHDLAEGSQVRQSSGDSLERLLLGGRQMVFHKKVAMVEQIANPLLNPFGFTGLSLPGLRGAASGEGRLLGLEFLADLSHRVQHCLGDLLEHVELADLMPCPGEQVPNDHGIQRRAIRGDPQNLQAASVQLGIELPEESPDVFLRRVVFQNPVREPLKGVIVYDAQYAERPVIDLVGREVAAERL